MEMKNSPLISRGCHANGFSSTNEKTGGCFGEVVRKAPEAKKMPPPLPALLRRPTALAPSAFCVAVVIFVVGLEYTFLATEHQGFR